ncbi:hypothetical protein LPJ66_003765 [Kickxella alabastrina]|uniref:Uncharacterized protein n=1 Tax=Kickxella alabastrina TaxID=61397 RepID=A0ACC1IJF1_9FUNG|nr:hypothetical protein LPJ66_003765 [Kickxella alabastrina]
MGPKSNAKRKPTTQPKVTLDTYFRGKKEARQEPQPTERIQQSGDGVQNTRKSVIVELPDSDSDVELVDANSLLGGPLVAPVTPVRANPVPFMDRGDGTPYRNSLKSLVQASAQSRHNQVFLDQHLQRDSRSDSEGEDEEEARKEEEEEALVSDIALVRGRVMMGSPRLVPRLIAFSRVARRLTTPNDNNGRTEDRKMLRLVSMQAYSGRRLDQSTGDTLVEQMCRSEDSLVAIQSYRVLNVYLDRHTATWRLAPALMHQLLAELLGEPTEQAAVVPPADDRGMTPPVYVEIVTRRPSLTELARRSAGRVAWLLEISSRASVPLQGVTGSKSVAAYIAVLADHRCTGIASSVQSSLACLVEGIGPSSCWNVVIPDAVHRSVRLVGNVPLGAQLRLVEAMPARSARSCELRRALAMSFLLRACGDDSDVSGKVGPEEAAQLVDPEVGLFVVTPAASGEAPDFARLEACVCLLGCLLDSVAEMRRAPVAMGIIRDRLAQLNSRISDRMAENISKTLAKDALQILLVRIVMTAATSDHSARLHPVYGANNLDNWLAKANT